MKTILSLFLIVLTASSIYSYGGGHDSLLFDGSGSKISTAFSNECKIKVVQVSGFAIGSVKIKELIQGCGDNVDTVYRTLNAEQLKVGYDIVENEEIRTGDDGFVKLELEDGSVMIVGPNSSLMFTVNLCKETKTLIKFTIGSLWTKVKKLIGGGKFEVSTERACACVRGTEFSVETNGTRDIVRVYESTVEVKMNFNTKEIEKSGGEMEQLAKDYQEGKITLEEYMAKVTEYSSKMGEMSDNMMNGTMVDAGNMVTVTDKVSAPEPLPTGETKWFEDARIK